MGYAYHVSSLLPVSRKYISRVCFGSPHRYDKPRSFGNCPCVSGLWSEMLHAISVFILLGRIHIKRMLDIVSSLIAKVDIVQRRWAVSGKDIYYSSFALCYDRIESFGMAYMGAAEATVSHSLLSQSMRLVKTRRVGGSLSIEAVNFSLSCLHKGLEVLHYLE